MRITIICDVLGEENNGTTIAAMNLIRSLKAKGHAVTVVCPDEFRRGEEGFVVVSKINFGIFSKYVQKNGVVIAKPDEETLRSAICGADVVHLVTPFLLAWKGLEIALGQGIPVTASFHCQAENISSHLFLKNATLFNKEVYHFLYHHIYRHCTAIHYPTQFICDVFESEIGVTTNHYCISNGVNKRFRYVPTPKPAEYADKYAILFTGRYSREKSHRVLIDAVAMSPYRDKIQLIFAGCGPLRDKLMSYCASTLPVMPVFRFFGRDEMLDVLCSSDLYVHPAEIEIEAIACLEAITCGLVPVIADSPRSATRFFALGENNLFKFNSPQSLCEKITYWIEHPDEKEKCRNEYKGFSAKFDQDVCMDGMEKMLADAANGRKTHGTEENDILQ